MRIQVFIVIALMVSKIVVSVVYLGYRVADASSKGMLPLDAELLKSDWQAILANTAYGSIVVAIMCLIYYAVKRRKLNVHINKNSISCPLVINWCIFTLALGFGLRMTLSYLIYFAVQTGILDDTNAMIQTVETSSSSIEYLIQLLVFTIIVPISEELFFRKMFVNDLMNVYERKKSNNYSFVRVYHAAHRSKRFLFNCSWSSSDVRLLEIRKYFTRNFGSCCI